MTALFFGLSVLFGLIFFYPYFIYPMLLRLWPARPVTPDPAAATPSATLVFCAYNEGRSIGDKIANLRAIREVAPDVKFACYVDVSTDDTLALLREHSDLIDVHAATERTGKAVGMSKLAKEFCDTEVMIFTDANVLVEPASIPRLLAYFSDASLGGICGTLIYTNEDATETAATSSFYWRLEELVKAMESRSGSTLGADGSIFATRRALYPYVPPHLMDDFIVSMSVIFAGRRLVSAPDVIAYEQAATASADEFRRKRRIACRAYGSHRHISHQVWKLAFPERVKYVSHRMIRWYGLVFAALSAAFFVLFLATLSWPLGVAAGLAIAAFAKWGGRLKIKGVSHAHEALILLWATLLGILDAWSGKTYQTWQPPQSR